MNKVALYKQAVQRAMGRYLFEKIAGPLTDPSKLRYQAVFMMGAGGSGKGWVGYDWLKYMPGGTPSGVKREQYLKMEEDKEYTPLSDEERRLSKLQFDKIKDSIEQMGFSIEVEPEGSRARIPFKLYEYDDRGKPVLINPSTYRSVLPPGMYDEVKNVVDIAFGTPRQELPTYWRVINPDLYKEEIPGYRPTNPGFVHNMSSQMSKAYFQATVQAGDPLFADGTGADLKKMMSWIKYAKDHGYKVSLVLVIVPLTVNQIRNATRPRKVNPIVVASQWKRIKQNFVALRSMADKDKVIINRNDQSDIKRYQKEGARINEFIRSTTQYENLYALIQDQAPSELTFWGRYIQP